MRTDTNTTTQKVELKAPMIYLFGKRDKNWR